jgi:hypothetical protein
MESSLKAKNRRDQAAAEYYFATIRFHQQAADAFDRAATQPWQTPLIPPEPVAPAPTLDQTIDTVEIPKSWTDLEVIMRPDEYGHRSAP